MTKVFGWIGQIGAVLMALGFFSALLNLVGLEFKALAWFDGAIGEGVMPRLVMAGVGLAMFVVGLRFGPKDEDEAEQPAADQA
ncbi:MAG: hypothetical protein ACRC2H_00285 [Silanimonas sp.]